ncbi:MAG: CBS domain-containing protein, partial [Candidatus Diapherotrites archaeon]|nr:CBS domain-containing protein [Candidatus Diapherotrites archaeon]
PIFGVFDKKNIENAKKFIDSLSQCVIKPEGLTGGKGVKVQEDHFKTNQEALDYCNEVLQTHNSVVVEEKLEGEEFSLQCLTDGKTVLATPPVQDHKRAFADDKGPNTGGMGSYSCEDHLLPFLTKKDVEDGVKITQKVADALNKETNQYYKGIMYAGLIKTKNGVKLLEYNARFGDPEAMNVLPLMETDFVSVEAHDSASQVIAKLVHARQPHAVVFDRETYVGLTHKESLLKTSLDIQHMKAASMTHKVAVLDPGVPLLRVAELMHGSHARMLPVMENNKINGVVTAKRLLIELQKIPALAQVPLSQIASKNLVTLPSSAPIRKIMAEMRENHVSRILLRNPKGALESVVSMHDLMQKVLLPRPAREKGFGGRTRHGTPVAAPKVGSIEKGLSFLPAENAASGTLVTLPVYEKAKTAARTILEKGTGSVVLLEGESPVGIVTVRDLLKCFLRLKEVPRNIQFVNLPELDEIDASQLHSEVEKTYDKFSKTVPNIEYLVVHVKAHSRAGQKHKEGSRNQYTVHLRLAFDGKLCVTEAVQWNLLSALQESLKQLEREVLEEVKPFRGGRGSKKR